MAKKIIYDSGSGCRGQLDSIYECDLSAHIPGLKKFAFIALKTDDRGSSHEAAVQLTDPREYWIDEDSDVEMSALVVNIKREAGVLDNPMPSPIWNLLKFNAEKSEFSCETQGSGNSKTFVNTLKLVFDGMTHLLTLAVSKMVNKDVAVVFQDQNDMWRVIGNNDWHTEVSVSQTSGAGASGECSTTVEFKCTDRFPAPFFEDVIEYKESPFATSKSSFICYNGITKDKTLQEKFTLYGDANTRSGEWQSGATKI